MPIESIARATHDEIESLLYDGNILEALSLLKKTQELDPDYVEEFDADFWNRFCWFGSLNGYSIEVRNYCEKAVLLNPENGGVIQVNRDSLTNFMPNYRCLSNIL